MYCSCFCSLTKDVYRVSESCYHKRLQCKFSDADIRQGSTIALQTSIRYNWLGCSPYCKAYRCPRMYFDYSDWSQCRGEVFRIYRSAGPGSIRVGDYVGLYYPAAHGHS